MREKDFICFIAYLTPSFKEAGSHSKTATFFALAKFALCYANLLPVREVGPYDCRIGRMGIWSLFLAGANCPRG